MIELGCHFPSRKSASVIKPFVRTFPINVVSTFEQLLANNNSVITHKRNLQLRMIEIFKTKSKLNPDFMTDIFKERSVSYNFRKGSDTLLSVVRTTTYGIETVSYIGNKLWQH